ncbi:EamA family transporter [Photobacterium sp. 1_MG-2023]|uniref:EamA family transporter n=1 Tax=Photobacterium sp. 1_MG-2023 TaxID=3062646 RepID=UPI0026E2A70A|nr:EamA family transporter [Photobacterium sp. 1_MG-2023]MDO6708180.1 EamA family transporter [Photobacterium sp. 1_MG-2023]
MNFKDALLGLFVMLIWGINFSVIKLGVSQTDPMLMTAIRFTLATVPLIFFVKKPNVPWRYLISYGVIFGVGVWGVASWSITAGLSAGMASVLLQTNVIFGLLIGFLVFQDKITANKVIGALFAGCGLTLSLMATDGTITLQGVVLILISALSWSLVSTIVKKSGTTQAFAFSIWGMAFAPVPLLIFALSLHGTGIITEAIEGWNRYTTFSVFFQAYPTTVFGYWVWNRLLLKYPLSTVAPVNLTVSVFGLMGGALFYGEPVGALQILAASLILSGVLVILLNPGRQSLVRMVMRLRRHASSNASL